MYILAFYIYYYIRTKTSKNIGIRVLKNLITSDEDQMRNEEQLDLLTTVTR